MKKEFVFSSLLFLPKETLSGVPEALSLGELRKRLKSPPEEEFIQILDNLDNLELRN